MTNNVIPFPKQEEKVLMVMLYVPLGNMTDKKAEKAGDKLADEILMRLDDVDFIEATYVVADMVEVH